MQKKVQIPKSIKEQAPLVIADINEACTIARKKCGRGFEYIDEAGVKIRCKKALSKIKKLAIPPMWQDVKVSKLHNSHVQAFGYDMKQRKQYIYHPIWHEQQQLEKFSRLKSFVQKLPTIRSAYTQDAEQANWSIEKAAAIATRILDVTGLRVGNKTYTQSNNTHGLSTLRRKHLEETDEGVAFSFVGKHKQHRYVAIDDEELSDLILASAEQPGYSILRYREGQKWHDLLSDDINEYIRSIAGDEHSSKDFRTWVGTRLAVYNALECESICRENARKKFKNALVKSVAEYLGNTPTICEKYYIHPQVLDKLVEFYKKGELSTWFESTADTVGENSSDSGNTNGVGYSANEQRAILLLQSK